MKIRISYNLYTDGDYSLENAEKDFGCQYRNVNIAPYFFDYAGWIYFEHEDRLICKENAIDFLWKFLCDGLHISYTHPWLLDDFYKLFKSLEDFIKNFEPGNNETEIIKEFDGNYSGTGFGVLIEE